MRLIPRVDAVCIDGEGAGIAMVNVAVCPAPSITVEGEMLHDDPVGTLLPQVSATVPV